MDQPTTPWNNVPDQLHVDPPRAVPSASEVCVSAFDIWRSGDRAAAHGLLGDTNGARLFEVDPIDSVTSSVFTNGDCVFDVETLRTAYQADLSIVAAANGARVLNVTWTELGDIAPRTSAEFCAALYWAWFGLDAHTAMNYTTPAAQDALFSRTERGLLPKNAFSTNGFDHCYFPTHTGEIADVILGGGDDGDELKAEDAIWFSEADFFADPLRAAAYESGIH